MTRTFEECLPLSFFILRWFRSGTNTNRAINEGRFLALLQYSLAGRRVTLRFDNQVMAVLDTADRTLLRTVPNPLTTRSVAYLRGARPAGPPPTPPAAGPVTVERIVSSSGGIMITRQRVQLGRQHARKVVTVTLDQHVIHVHDGPNLLVTVPRTTTQEVTHRRAHNH